MEINPSSHNNSLVAERFTPKRDRTDLYAIPEKESRGIQAVIILFIPQSLCEKTLQVEVNQV